MGLARWPVLYACGLDIARGMSWRLRQMRHPGHASKGGQPAGDRGHAEPAAAPAAAGHRRRQVCRATLLPGAQGPLQGSFLSSYLAAKAFACRTPPPPAFARPNFPESPAVMCILLVSRTTAGSHVCFPFHGFALGLLSDIRPGSCLVLRELTMACCLQAEPSTLPNTLRTPFDAVLVARWRGDAETLSSLPALVKAGGVALVVPDADCMQACHCDASCTESMSFKSFTACH